MAIGNQSTDHAEGSYKSGWQGLVERELGYDYDTQFMLDLYIEAMDALYKTGWELPYDDLNSTSFEKIRTDWVEGIRWNPTN